MYLLAGLGNTGDIHIHTRHNSGREIVEAFQKKMGFREFVYDKKLNALISLGKIKKKEVVLILPETFVNKSGAAILPTLRRYKIKPKNLILVHDDADISFGRCKLSFAKRAAGHKGVESVIRALKTKEFWRFRIGIAGKRDIPAEKLVLKKFTPEEMRMVKKISTRTMEFIEIAVSENPERAMNGYNT